MWASAFLSSWADSLCVLPSPLSLNAARGLSDTAQPVLDTPELRLMLPCPWAVSVLDKMELIPWAGPGQTGLEMSPATFGAGRILPYPTHVLAKGDLV